MIAERKKNPLRLLAAVLLAVALLTACSSKAEKVREKLDLGQKYLTEQNYTEAVASFTEAIGLDPENITAYLGRAQAYEGMEQYDDAKADYTRPSKRPRTSRICRRWPMSDEQNSLRRRETMLPQRRIMTRRWKH